MTAVESGERVESPRAKAAKPPAGLWLLPSFTDLAMLLPVLFLFVRMDGLNYLLGDTDTGWHIRTGQWILEHGRVPTQDIFSFTMAGRPWFAWEWLWDVTFGSLYGWGGLAVVAVVSLAVICATFGLLYRLVRQRCGNMLIAIAVTALAAMISSIHWLARPHLFTSLFTVAFLWLLERAREGRTHGLILLPLLTVLWTNLHGGFFVGAVLVLIYATGEMTGGLFAAERRALREGFARSKPYLWTAGACVAASLINPQFYKLHVHIIRFLTDRSATAKIDEFRAFDFSHGVAPYFEVMLVCGVLAAGWSAWNHRWTQAILVSAWAHLALISVRNLPLFALVAAPTIAQAFEEFLVLAQQSRGAAWVRRQARTVEELGREYIAIDGLGRFPVIGAFALVLMAVLSCFPARSPVLEAEFDAHKLPAKAAAVLRPGSRVFTTDQWGGYLIYRFYPKQKVFIDGRSDFYGAEFCNRYLALLNVRHDWAQLLERYGIDTVLLPAETALASTLKRSVRWRLIYDDGIAIVFQLKNNQVSAGSLGGVFPVVARSRKLRPVIPGSPSTLMRGDA